jgi:hypothetical protein
MGQSIRSDIIITIISEVTISKNVTFNRCEQLKKNSAKAPEPQLWLYYECCLQKGSWNFNFFCIRKSKVNIFASDILYFRISIFSSRKYSEKSKVYYITWYTVTVVFTSDLSVGNDAQVSGLRHRFVGFDLYLIHQK